MEPRPHISVPPISWSSVFTPLGPEEDPAILLTAEASLAGVQFGISALRMQRRPPSPDYHDDVALRVYKEVIESMIDDIEDLIGSVNAELISIGEARYLLWIAPTAHD